MDGVRWVGVDGGWTKTGLGLDVKVGFGWIRLGVVGMGFDFKVGFGWMRLSVAGIGFDFKVGFG